MAYSKTEWKARQGINLNKFTKSQETDKSVLLTNTPDSVTEPGTPFSAENMNHIEEGIADAHDAIEQETQSRQTADDAINEKIPNQASADNQLADKDFVISSITAMAARPLTYNAEGSPFPTKEVLNNAADFYYKGQPVTPTDNDYVVVQTDETQNNGQVRYGYAGGVWVFRYKINDAPLTAAQIAAINSGATAENIASFIKKSEVVNTLFSDSPDTPLSAAMGKYLKGIIDSLTFGMYPVGSIFLSVSSANPSAFFGGTWVRFGNGNVLVGVSEGESEFNTVEKKGGAKNHALTEAQMPSHNHNQDEHSHEYWKSQNQSGGNWDGFIDGQTNYSGQLWTSTATPYIHPKGGGQAHNNLQPYITVYIWKRTA